MANKSRYGVKALPAASSSSQVVPHKERRVPIVDEVNVVGIQDSAKNVKQMLLNGEMRRLWCPSWAWVAWERQPLLKYLLHNLLWQNVFLFDIPLGFLMQLGWIIGFPNE